MKSKYLLFTLISIFISLPVESNDLPWNIRFTHKISAKADFVGEVLVVHQDRFGYVWVGGKSGVARYDGFSHEVFAYDHESTNTIANSIVNAIAEDKDGNLWFGTNSGLSRYQRDKKQFTNFYYDPDNKQSLSHERVISLHRENDTLWVGTETGLDSVDLNTYEITRHPETENLSELKSIYVLGIDTDDTGKLYFVSGSGLKIWDRSANTIEVYGAPGEPLPEGLQDGRIRSILRASSGMIWLGTVSGISRFDPKTGKFKMYYDETYDAYAKNSEVWDLHEDRYGEIWVASDGSGLMRYDAERDMFRSYTHDKRNHHSISSSVVHSIMEDEVGDIWLGMYPAGVDVIHRDTAVFQVFSNTSDDNRSINWSGVTSIVEDDNNDLWLATDGGGLNIYRSATQTFEFINQKSSEEGLSLKSPAIMSLLHDKKGNYIWIGYWDGGVSRLDLNTYKLKHFEVDPEDPKKLSSSDIFSVYQDRNQDVWVASMDGELSKYNEATDTLDIFELDGGLEEEVSYRIWVISEDSKDNLWLGTDRGLLKVDRASRSSVRYDYDPKASDSISNSTVHSILEDSKARLWVATSGGLNQYHYDTNTFTHIRKKDGLGDERVFHIIEDDNGLLWLSTKKGITSFNPETREIRNYTVISGEQSIQFHLTSGTKAKNGDLIFGSIQGYVRFNPNNISINTHVPNVYLTDLRVFNRPVPINDGGILENNIFSAEKIVLDHTQNLFTLNFSALNYRNSERNKYSYKLDGFDSEWQNVENLRTATYTNLDPGSYQFHVKGSNDSDIWNEKGASINIVIIPPPWRTWWAYALYVLIITASISWYVYTQRKIIGYQKAMVDNLSEVDKIKDQFIASTSHELRTPLFGIVGLAETLLGETKAKLNNTELNSLEMIIASGKRLVTQVNDILDLASIKRNTLSINIQPINLFDISEVVIQLLRPTMQSDEVVLENLVDRDNIRILGDPNRVQQILINLASNALRHTQKGKVSISAYPEGPNIVVVIADTGTGIPKEKIKELFEEFKQLGDAQTRARQGGTGIGLTITKRLLDLQGGKIWVESEVGKGSKFIFTLPKTDKTAEEFTVSMAASARIKRVAPVSNGEGSHQETVSEPKGEAIQSQVQSPDSVRKKQYHILIVDDETVNRMVLSAYLKTDNYIILEAADGDEAVQLVESRPEIDLVILDVNMPGISGLDACKKMRAIRDIRSLPILFSTAQGSTEDLVECYESGGNDFLQKPIERKELLAHIKFHLHLYDMLKAYPEG